MANKHLKSKHENAEYDDEDDYVKEKKKDSPRRRPVRNWKKAWIENQDQYDEYDDFYGRKR